MKLFLDRIRDKLPPKINGDGTQFRDFVFVDDVANAMYNLNVGIPGGPTVSASDIVRGVVGAAQGAAEEGLPPGSACGFRPRTFRLRRNISLLP